MVLFEIDKGLEVGLHSAMLLFCLAINLKVKNREEPLFDAKEVAEQWPKLKSK